MGLSLSGAKFKGCTLQDTMFVEVDFLYPDEKKRILPANLDGSTLNNCYFKNCNLNGVDFTKATFPDPENVFFLDSTLAGARFALWLCPKLSTHLSRDQFQEITWVGGIPKNKQEEV